MLISIVLTVLVGLIYFYLQLPAINLHSAEFYSYGHNQRVIALSLFFAWYIAV